MSEPTDEPQRSKEALAMILKETYTLSNGIEIPRLGLGTWFISNGDVVQAVKSAATIGYRHIDTAKAYGNEEGVGEAIRTSGVSRYEMFVTTKLAAEVKAYEQAVKAIDESLETIGLDHLDLMIIHSPQPWREFGGDERYFEGNRQAWRALEEAYEAGKLRAIGLSNFEREDLDNILGTCTVKPMVNQILAHISNTPHELIRYTQEHGILVEAYSPIAHGELLKNEQVREIAENYEVTVPRRQNRGLRRGQDDARLRRDSQLMASWSQDELAAVGEAEELEIAPARADGSLRRGAPI